jgi:type IV secretory pathway VirB3-like protein
MVVVVAVAEVVVAVFVLVAVVWDIVVLIVVVLVAVALLVVAEVAVLVVHTHASQSAGHFRDSALPAMLLPQTPSSAAMHSTGSGLPLHSRVVTVVAVVVVAVVSVAEIAVTVLVHVLHKIGHSIRTRSPRMASSQYSAPSCSLLHES